MSDNTIHFNLVSKYFGMRTGDEGVDLKLSILIAGYKKALEPINAINSDPRLSDEAKKQDTEKILIEAQAVFNKAVEELLQPVLSKPFEAHQKLAQSFLQEPAGSDIEQTRAIHQQSDDKAALRAMSIEQRSKLLRDTASQGDRRVLDAIESSLDLSQGLALEGAKSLYVSAAKPDLLKAVSDAERSATSSKMIQQMLPGAASKIAGEQGLNLDAALQARREARKAKAQGSMSTEQKAKYISDHGSESYMKMMSGE